jgi:branched-chain amino acid transport system permease protein
MASTAFQLIYQFGDAFAFLVISAAGLAVIFGMMGIINLAHGEFIMCGAYATVLASRAGLPLPIAIATGALAAGIVGMIIERLVIRRLYHRPVDSIVATWGISLIATQGVLIFLGSTMQGIGTPFGSVTVGAYSYSVYRLVSSPRRSCCCWRSTSSSTAPGSGSSRARRSSCRTWHPRSASTPGGSTP